MQEEDKRSGSGDDDAQMAAIQAEKTALAWSLLGRIFLSLICAAALYGLTIVQNPDLKPSR